MTKVLVLNVFKVLKLLKFFDVIYLRGICIIKFKKIKTEHTTSNSVWINSIIAAVQIEYLKVTDL